MIFLTQINSKKCFLLNVRKPAMINQYAIYSTLRNILQITVKYGYLTVYYVKYGFQVRLYQSQ